MGGGEFLTKDEFNRWAKGVDEQLAKLEPIGQNLAVLRDRSNREDRRTTGIAAIVSAAVSGAVMGILSWLTPGRHA